MFGKGYSYSAPSDAPQDGGSLPYLPWLQADAHAREGAKCDLPTRVRTCSWEGVALACPVFSPVPPSHRQCQQDAALWQTLHLDQTVSLDELLNISQVSVGVPGSGGQSWGRRAGAAEDSEGPALCPITAPLALAVHRRDLHGL